MALGRSSRNNKRSSYTSYTSTVTTIVFVALCVVGVWMLTSDSFVPPQTATTKRSSSSSNAATTTATAATTTAATAATTNDDFSSSVKTNDKKDTTSYEDNPGDLPDDAIKSDDSRQSDGNNGNNNANDNKDGANGTSQENQAQETDVDKGAGSTDDKQGSQDQERGGGNIKSDEVKSESSNEDAAEVSTQGLHGKESGGEHEKQNENENQVSEESTTTQSQQSVESNEQSNDEQQQQQQSNEDASGNQEKELAASSQNGGNSQEGENKYTDDDQQQQQQKLQVENNDSSNEDQKPQQENDTATQEPEKPFLDVDEKKRIEEQQRLREEDESTSQPQQKSQEEAHRPEETTDRRREHVEATSPAQQEHDEMPVQTDTHQNAQQDEELHKTDGSFPTGENTGIPKESKESKKSWSTQAAQSENQKERRGKSSDDSIYGYAWQLCNVTAGPDYIPCLDNEKALKKLRSTKHFEHRERHCPEDAPTCLVLAPEGYKRSIEWPKSREKIWYYNVPHKSLADVKGHQNWVKVTGEFLTFPGGGTQFIHGALHYIDFLQASVPNIKWGKHTRVILDVGCGVASFGGYLFERDVLTMSFAPKDEHEAQVQFALERGIPAISAVMGSQRLPFPSRVFDLVHCARCRVPWHAEGGLLLLELNRVLRPGGFFIWSATPVYQKLQEDVQIWKEMSALTANMCWELVTIQKDKLNSIGAAIYRKPRSNDCYEQRNHNSPPMCKNDDDPNAAWYVPLQACMHWIPVNEAERGAKWPVVWPRRMRTPPYWLNSSQIGIYGKPAPQDFSADYEHWKRVVSGMYMSGLGISWSGVRNVMDMRAVYGGFAAALKDLSMWVMNVVNVDSPDTLPIIYERGLFGIYHDWCESFSTYPRTYDLLHADHLFSKLKKRCKLAPVMAEVDRIVRPGGKIIVRDESGAIGEIENLLKSLHWEVHLTFSKDQEGILSAQKGDWRPNIYTATS
ncbi:hypothetical protein BT93_I0672 [Corymbia citriodora subsp. variegata]|nr:hypothetical protein BT93_I0672 [Corymbia citriodora subsp. variegata]